MRIWVFLPTIHIVLGPLDPIPEAASESTDTCQVGPNQGLTLEDLRQGLKSAAKTIGYGIPKIGTAIGETFKKVTGSEKEKDQPNEMPQNSTKSKK